MEQVQLNYVDGKHLHKKLVHTKNESFKIQTIIIAINAITIVVIATTIVAYIIAAAFYSDSSL